MQTPQPGVPFVDLAVQHQQVAEEVRAAINGVMDQTSFVLGPQVAAFEQEFADFCGVEHCVGVGNGTDAIELALRAAGVGRGDEVVIPANTFVATAEAVVRAGAEPVLADCDEDFLLDPVSVAEQTTRRTRAVIPVHLYGQMAPVKEIADAVGRPVVVVEDAAQSQGASQGGRRAGGLGDVAATSFYPGKNLGAYGDAGAVLTGSADIAGRIQALRNHGGIRKYEHELIGTNSRLDSIQAAVLSVKLRHLDAWNAQRREAAERYEEMLGDLEQVRRPRVVPGNEHVWHLYVVRVPSRDEVAHRMTADGIGVGVHYPVPVGSLAAFAELPRSSGSLSRAESMATEILSLPMFPGITPDQQARVVDSLRRALG